MAPSPPASETKCSKQGSALGLSQHLGAEAGQLPQVQVLGLARAQSAGYAPASTEGKQEKERRGKEKRQGRKEKREKTRERERQRGGRQGRREGKNKTHTFYFLLSYGVNVQIFSSLSPTHSVNPDFWQ